MKRKAMLMGAALIAGVPAGAHAKSEGGEGIRAVARLAWESAYSPHYGPATVSPLMEHLETAGSNRTRLDVSSYLGGIVEAVKTRVASPAGAPEPSWRLDFSMPQITLPSIAEPGDVQPGRRLGITLSFSF